MRNQGDYSEQRDGAVSPGPILAIAEADLRGLFRSRITFAWLLGALLIQLIRTMSSRESSIASVVPSGLGDFVNIWALVIIGLAASSVSSEAGELADSVLSKSVTRLDYVVAKFAARIGYTLACFGMVAAVLTGLALRLDIGGGYSAQGLVSSTLLVALIMATLTALGVALSIVLPNTVVAIVALLVVWYGASLLFPLVGLEALSASYVVGKLPEVVSGVWGTLETDALLGFLAILVVSTILSSAYFHVKDV